MARPTRQGVDYFPLDVHLDDKFKFIEIRFGLEGFAVIVKLLQKIYSCGYWYQWGEDELLIFAHENNMDQGKIQEIIDESLKRDIFNQEMYDNFEILTSSGIQKRYKEIVKRRKDIEIVTEYLLVNNSFGVNANIVHTSSKHHVSKSTQSKVKESKVNKSIVKNSSKDLSTELPTELSTTKQNNVFEVFEKNIHPPSPMEMEKLKDWIWDLEEEVIIMAIKEAVNQNVRNMNYINAILNNWHRSGVKTKEDVLALKRDNATKKPNTNYQKQNNKSNGLDMDHTYDMDELEKKLLRRNKSG